MQLWFVHSHYSVSFCRNVLQFILLYIIFLVVYFYLQCCITFFWMANWFNYTCIYYFVYSFPLWFIIIYWNSSLCFTVGSCYLSFLHNNLQILLEILFFSKTFNFSSIQDFLLTCLLVSLWVYYCAVICN